ncbi:CASP-like protein 1F1 [Ipomoea triloba]|uniref:CASP-like protein 1F1 n=1 Tax=Ipomoea triloba TaxID=35885 RepID=UPI00125D234D|nr:CASP-like protein 1F1 [Ipomoea triloba]
MESFGSKGEQKQPPLKAIKRFSAIQVVLRLAVTALTLAAAWTVLTSKQTVSVFGIQMDARYSYSPAFKFLAVANIIGFGFSLLSVLVVFILDKMADNPKHYFYMFLHDLIVMALLLSGCASATAIGYVGKFGESQSGWMPVCDNVSKFCHKITVGLTLSYIAVIFYLILTVLSANQSRKSMFQN